MKINFTKQKLLLNVLQLVIGQDDAKIRFGTLRVVWPVILLVFIQNGIHNLLQQSLAWNTFTELFIHCSLDVAQARVIAFILR